MIIGESARTTLPRGKVLIVDSVRGNYVNTPDVERQVLGKHVASVEILRVSTVEELHGAIDDALGIISWHHVPFEAGTLGRMRNCRAIVRAGVGIENVDIEAAASLGILVANVPDYGTEEVADHTLALLLGSTRQLLHCDKHVRGGGWEWRAIGEPGRLRGKVLGIVGFGRIGAAVCRRAQAFGLRVAFYDPYVPSGTDKVHSAHRAESLDELCGMSDIISIHTPLTPTTRGMFGTTQLARMKPSALLINTARGAIVDTAALVRSIEEGRLSFAALDVVDTEPLIPKGLLDSDRVLLTPHAAFYAREGLDELRLKAATHLLNMIQGRRIRDLVNLPAAAM